MYGSDNISRSPSREVSPPGPYDDGDLPRLRTPSPVPFDDMLDWVDNDVGSSSFFGYNDNYSSDEYSNIDTSDIMLFTKQPDSTWLHRCKTFHTFDVKLPKLTRNTKLTLDLVVLDDDGNYIPFTGTKKDSVFRRKPTYIINGKTFKMEQDPSTRNRYTMDVFSSYGDRVVRFETAPDVSNKKKSSSAFYYQIRVNDDIIVSAPFRSWNDVSTKPKHSFTDIADSALDLLRKLEWYDNQKCLLCRQERPQYHLENCDFRILYK